MFDGEDEVREYFRRSRTPFPDQRNELVALHHGDDAIVVELDLLGTHLGPLGDHRPTGRTFRRAWPRSSRSRRPRTGSAASALHFDPGTILRQLGHGVSALHGTARSGGQPYGVQWVRGDRPDPTGRRVGPGLNRDAWWWTRALAIVDRRRARRPDHAPPRQRAAGSRRCQPYHWFPNKAAILGALVEAAIRETATRVDATPEAGWRANLRALATGCRCPAGHPNTVSCMGGRPGRSVETMRFIERMLDVLRSDGFSPVHAVRSMQSVLAYQRRGLGRDRAG